MDSFKSLYNADMTRFGDKKAEPWSRRFLYYLRKVQTCRSKVFSDYYRFRFRRLCDKRGIEMSAMMKVGKGLYIGHAYNITINSRSVIGDNVNIHKGVTIGQENRGRRKGTPVIGNKVWIGVNATIVGNVRIGDDVLIAPNSFVNCDVPDHSVVFGNPCRIVGRENATEHYLNHTV